MSKIVYLCSRAGRPITFNKNDIALLAKKLTPDNTQFQEPRIIKQDSCLIGIFDPVESHPVKDLCVCLGNLFSKDDIWWRCGTPSPDGTYAIFRSDGSTLELLTDTVASRSIWYTQTADLFVASTSQRAIVFFLQSFELNQNVIPWMLSSGTLGPELSWDKRIRFLPNNAWLKLNRASWKIKISRESIRYTPKNISEKEYKNNLFNAIKDTFSSFTLDYDKWLLPLSGGYDSRMIYLMLKNNPGLKTITWGVKSAPADKKSDAYVAKKLADTFNIPHQYFEMDTSDEAIDKIFDRFLMAGEGRVDHISGYMDGFDVWKNLREKGYSGVIRGDEAFGCYAVKSSMDVYRNMSLSVLSDYDNLQQLLREMGFYKQTRPQDYEKRDNESLEEWRDRLSIEFENSHVFAALNDLKLAYVDLVNPLLSRKIINSVRQLPSSLRTNKQLFKNIVNDITPPIAYAKHPAIASKGNILKQENVVQYISAQLTQAKHAGVIPENFLEYALNHLAITKNTDNCKISSTIQSLLGKVKRKLGIPEKLLMDNSFFAFRVFMICRMSEILRDDAKAYIDTFKG